MVAAGSSDIIAGETPRNRKRDFRALGSACLAHIVHDGYSDVLYLLFPIWQREFALSLSTIGAMKTLFSGTLALFQIPATRLAAGLGERAVLAMGTLLAASAALLYSFAGSVSLLFGLLFLAGLGAAVQHPLSSAIVARAFHEGGSRQALATYNFAGDVGKVLLPAAAALLIWLFDWRTAIACLGLFGLAIVFVLLWLIPTSDGAAVKEIHAEKSSQSPPLGGAQVKRGGFATLTLIGVIDNTTRTSFLTFLPLLLSARGTQATAIGTALSLIFVGGAAGKFACGVLAERMGIIRTVIATEVATAVLIVGLLVLPQTFAFFLMLPLGIALNGTSSVLYGSVAELAPPTRRSQAFALFYTLTLGAGAVGPSFYGLIGDRIGIFETLLVIAAAVLLVLPLAGLLSTRLGGTTGAGERKEVATP